MNKIIYNVDKENVFKELVVVSITSSDFFLYRQIYEYDVGIGFTVPEFLGRLRLVSHDGFVVPAYTVDKVFLPTGSLLYIAPNGSVAWKLPNDEKIYGFAFESFHKEIIVEKEFTNKCLGEFNSFRGLSEKDLYEYVDSYKFPVLQKKVKNGVCAIGIYLDDTSYVPADYSEEELNYDEMSF